MTKFWTVDAFTNTPYTGNPAGVIIVPQFPDDATCQHIAAEVNLSETAFIKHIGPNHFHIRWFTPHTEVKLCGHATLASAHVLWEEGLVSENQIILDSLSGDLRVLRQENAIVLDFPLQPTGERLSLPPFAECLQVKESDIVQVVQAHDDVIVELAHVPQLRTLTVDMDALMKIPCRGVIVTAKAEAPYDFISRFFAPAVCVPEDPVTGSAHCKLADYWHKKTGRTIFLAYQASRRGGEIGVELKGERVYLKGQAVTIMAGEWRFKPWV